MQKAPSGNTRSTFWVLGLCFVTVSMMLALPACDDTPENSIDTGLVQDTEADGAARDGDAGRDDSSAPDLRLDGELDVSNEDLDGDELSVPPDPDQIGFWRFDEASGSIASDSSLALNHGSLSGAEWSTGWSESALSFDGTEAHVIVPSTESLALTAALTVEAWVNPDPDCSGYIISKNEARQLGMPYAFLLGTDGTIDLYLENALFSSGVTPPSGQWSHVAASWDGSAIRFYMSGEELAAASWSGELSSNGHRVLLGARNDEDGLGSAYHFEGSIDELQLWRVARSHAEICKDAGREWSGSACQESTTPQILISPTRLDFSATQAQPSPPAQRFTVTNGGSGSLEWRVDCTEDWISCTPDSGSSAGDADIVTVSIDHAGLSASDYRSSIVVRDVSGVHPASRVEVYLSVLGGPPPEPVTLADIRTEHPRIWLNPNNIDAIRARALGGYLSTYEELKALDSMLGNAFVYAIEGDQARAADAISSARSWAGNIASMGDREDRQRAQAAYDIALVLDWCFDADAMTSTARDALIDGICDALEWLDGSHSGIASMDEVWKSHPTEMSGENIISVIAIAHDGGARANALVENRLALTQSGYFPRLESVLANHGGWHMGQMYYSTNLMPQLEAVAALTSASGTDIFARTRFFARGMEFLLYQTRDLTRGVARLYEDNNWSYYRNGHYRMANIIASGYRSAHARWLVERMEDWRTTYNWEAEADADCKINRIIWDDPQLAAQAPDSLPHNANFGLSGYYVMRSGWQPEDTLVVFKSLPYYLENHNDRNNGSFSIFHNDAQLALNSGVYDSYGTPHHRRYKTKAIAHNTLLIGGNFVEPLRSYALDTVDTFGYSELLLYEATLEHTCIAVDLSGAYDPLTFPVDHRPDAVDRCEKQKRYLVYLPELAGWDGPAIIIYDYAIANDPSFEKRYLLHSENSPNINSATGLITIDEGDGRLFDKVLFAERYTIQSVGGPSTPFLDWDYDALPVDPMPWVGAAGDFLFGQYRVEVVPRSPKLKDLFLNVLLPTDTTVSSAPRIDEIETDTVMGTRVADQVLVFGKEDGPLDVISYTVVAAGSHRHLLVDCYPNGIYSLERNGTPAGTVTASQDGVISVRLDLGLAEEQYSFEFTGNLEANPVDIETYYPRD